MKLNNKGFAISGILYSLLILFLSLFIGLLGILASTKFSYDKVKNDIINKLGNLPYKDDILNGADPILKEGMIPVTLSNDGKVFKANLKDKWYDYDTKMWANAVIVENTNRESYLNAPSGTEINENDILAYFVWIPRYKYKLWYTETIEEDLELDTTKIKSIDIVFENKNSVKSLGTKNDEYLTHPAFTFGEEELDGIWVGKFETGYNGVASKTDAEMSTENPTKLIIKPNTYSWRNIKISNIYSMVKNMNTASNIFGLNTDSDTHMMKNTEWGAIAYLSHSNYGLLGQVNLNTNSDNITGCGMSLVVNNTCQNRYGTVENYNQSTNGNITGVFDMSGGANEYVMAYTTDYGESGFTTLPEAKYLDIYTSENDKNYSKRILGDATGEMGPFNTYTSSWYNSISKFIDITNPWFIRGGNYNENGWVFSFSSATGAENVNIGFRVVIS